MGKVVCEWCVRMDLPVSLGFEITTENWITELELENSLHFIIITFKNLKSKIVLISHILVHIMIKYVIFHSVNGFIIGPK